MEGGGGGVAVPLCHALKLIAMLVMVDAAWD